MTHDAVFRCPAIGRYLSVGACLRRQGEQRLVTVVVREASEGPNGTLPRITEQRAAGPAYPDCASGACELGRKHAAEAAPEPPRPAPERKEPASVIWSGGVPDVPLPAPPSGVAKPKPFLMFPLSTTVVERRHSPTHQPTSSTDKPAQPAEEESSMPKGLRTGGPCKGCGAKGARCRAGCPAQGGAAAPAKKKPQEIVLPPVSNPVALFAAMQSAPSVQVPRLSDDQLGALVEQVIAEIKRRQVEAQQRLERLRELREKLGEAA